MLAAVGLYLLFLPLWWYLLPALAYLSAFFAEFLYRLFDPLVSIQAQGRVVNFVVKAAPASGFGGQEHKDALRFDTVSYSLPMFVALAVVTRADSWRARLRALLGGVMLLSCLTVPIVMLWAKLTSLELDARIAESFLTQAGDRTSFLYYALQGYAFSQPVIAVLIWLGLMMLGFFQTKPRAQAARESLARNATCPCGSGRKYKRCCGRT